MVSPQTRFVVAPCSVYSRRGQQGAIQRYTACAVESPKSQLICFADNHRGEGSIKTFRKDLDFLEDPLVGLEVQEHEGNADGWCAYQVLVTQASGRVRCFSQCLTKEFWTTDLRPINKEEGDRAFNVRSLAWISSTNVGKLWLKAREDLVAHINLMGGRSPLPRPLLLAVIKEKDGFKVSLYHLQHGAVSQMQSSPAVFADLVISDGISIDRMTPSRDPEFRIDTTTGTLAYASKQGIAVLSLKGFVPTPKHLIPKMNLKPLTFRLISHKLAITAHMSTIALIDLQYNAVLETRNLPLTAKLSTTDISGLVSRSTIPQESISILCFLKRWRMTVILRDRQLYACDLEDEPSRLDNPRKRKREGGLSRSIFRGNMHDRIPASVPSSLSKRQMRTSGMKPWEPEKSPLGNGPKRGDVDSFDEIMLKELNTSIPLRRAKADEISSWAVQNRYNSDIKKIDYFLTQVFRVQRGERAPLSTSPSPIVLIVQLLPKNLHHWLSTRGLFTRNQVHISLRRKRLLQGAERLTWDAFVKALILWDPSLEVALSTLTNGCGLDTEELIFLLRAYLDLREDQSSNTNVKAISTGADPASHGQKLHDQVNETETLTPSQVSSRDRGETLNGLFSALLTRLQKQPPSDVSRALQKHLSKPHLQILIDSLRLHLASGGWLTSSQDITELSASPRENEAALIANLFDCVMNVIGISGWTVGPSSSDNLTSIAGTIRYMKAEISAAIDGILDAERTEAILRQLLLFQSRVTEKGAYRQRSRRSLQVKKKLLPIGVPKPIMTISTHRVSAGGVLQQRTARDIGRLKSRAVGEYSFEKINV